MRELREDLRLIYDWIAPNSKVLDLGCGDGQLLAALVEEKNCIGYGVELDTDSVIAAMGRITTTRHRPSVHSAASVGRLGIFISNLRCSGAKRMARMTPQKTAP